MADQEKLDRLKKLSTLLDSKFTGPFGIRFGLDGLLGLIPFVGDLICNIISLYILVQAVSFGCGPSVLARMGLNLLIESLLEVVPFFGNVFDFFWRANEKNIRILEGHLSDSKSVQIRSRFVLAITAFTLLAIIVGSLALTVLLFYKFLEFFNLAFS